MKIFLEYFWIFCSLLWLLQIYVLSYRELNSLISSGTINKKEVKAFRKQTCLSIIIPAILLQLFQIGGGFADPFLLFLGSLSNPWVLASLSVVVFDWLILLYWLWFKDGNTYFSKYAPVLRLPRNPVAIRLLFTVTVILASMMLIFIHSLK
jgi:hypothetical protein